MLSLLLQRVGSEFSFLTLKVCSRYIIQKLHSTIFHLWHASGWYIDGKNVQNIAFANAQQAKAFLEPQKHKGRLYNGLAVYHKRYIAECICGRCIDCKNKRVHITKATVCSSAYWKGKHRPFYVAVQTLSYPAGSF